MKFAMLLMYSMFLLFAELYAQESQIVNNPSPQSSISDGTYIRIRPLSNRGQRTRPAKWDPVGYTAQDILGMIADLQPTVLERYTDGRMMRDDPVPVAEGEPPMTVLEFLNASMKAGAPGCIITPRVSFHEYAMGTLFSTAQSLYDLPLDPPMRILSLDNWGNINKDGLSQDELRTIFETLAAQGWHHIAVNMVGGLHDPMGYAEIAEFGVLKNERYMPNLTKLSRMKELPYLRKHLLYIDFPGQIAGFLETYGPDERADHLVKVLAGLQEREGYTFVWPILQGKWDSTQLHTSPKGPYKGASLYEVMKQAMTK
jgi:hypothetical protein